MSNQFFKQQKSVKPCASRLMSRKKGPARLIEIGTRDFADLLKLNLMMIGALLPSLSFLGLTIYFFGQMIAFVFGFCAILACLLHGPAYASFYRGMTLLLMDMDGPVWRDFIKNFRASARQTMLPGLLTGVSAGAQGLIFSGIPAPAPGLAVLAAGLSCLLIQTIAPYYFLQAAYLDIAACALIKNSLILSLSAAPRGLCAAAVVILCAVASLVFLPVSLPFVLCIGFTLPGLVSMLLIWPPVDLAFGIENALRRKPQR